MSHSILSLGPSSVWRDHGRLGALLILSAVLLLLSPSIGKEPQDRCVLAQGVGWSEPTVLVTKRAFLNEVTMGSDPMGNLHLF